MKAKLDTCEIFCYNETTVNRLQPIVNAPAVSSAARMFKALADETRAKIAYALCQEPELCVCDIAHIAGCTTATASHHLRTLNKLGLAKYRKEGKLVFYALRDHHAVQLMQVAVAHAQEGYGHDERT